MITQYFESVSWKQERIPKLYVLTTPKISRVYSFGIVAKSWRLKSNNIRSCVISQMPTSTKLSGGFTDSRFSKGTPAIIPEGFILVTSSSAKKDNRTGRTWNVHNLSPSPVPIWCDYWARKVTPHRQLVWIYPCMFYHGVLSSICDMVRWLGTTAKDV